MARPGCLGALFALIFAPITLTVKVFAYLIRNS